jgi:DNA-binding response OmpR family regulator
VSGAPKVIVLVVEDNLVTADGMRDFLTLHGYRAVAAYDGLEIAV